MNHDTRERTLDRRLRDCPPCEPTRGQKMIIEAAVKLGHEAGLRIPTPPPILTVAGPRDGIQGGEFEFEEGRRSQFRIWVNVGDAVMPERLFWSTSHELKHLDDCVRGLPYDEKIWDDRAIAYAARASERWRRMQWLFAMERRSR